MSMDPTDKKDHTGPGNGSGVVSPPKFEPFDPVAAAKLDPKIEPKLESAAQPKPEPPKVELPKVEPLKVDAVKIEPAKVEPARPEAPKAETPEPKVAPPPRVLPQELAREIAREAAREPVREPARATSEPRRIRTIAMELDRLGVDDNGRLYWDGKPVEARQRLHLTGGQRLGAFLVGLALIAGGIGAAAQGVIAVNEWGCRTGRIIAAYCPPKPAATIERPSARAAIAD